ncbi:hypothetical protein RB599_010109 [Gaeumannomyces hyphopodioides]
MGYTGLLEKGVGRGHHRAVAAGQRVTADFSGSHPYLVSYHGCRVHRGWITGIVLEKRDSTLHTLAKDRAQDFARLDREAFFGGVQSAVLFLHSLGLAHNGINPSNIMVGKAGEPILIDFGSCGGRHCNR